MIFIIVDVVFWLTCEIWIQMYGDWNDTEWGYIVGSENYYIEMHMESFLANVEPTFYIKGRGLIVAPSFPVSEYKFDTQERIRVETPEGTELFCDAYFQIPFQNPRPKVLSFCCALLNVTKESIPIGSKLYIIGKSSIDIQSINTSN